MSKKEVTNSEVFDEVKVVAGNVGVLTTHMNSLASHVNIMATEMHALTTNVHVLTADVNVLTTHLNDLATHVDDLATRMDERFDEHDKRFAHIEQRMVTKDYLDDKIGSLRGELVVLTRREDAKLASLVEELYSEESLSATGRKSVLGMEPFARKV